MIGAEESRAKSPAEHKIPARRNVFEAVYNRLAGVITPPFLHTSCTPNQITILSGIFGVIGAVLLVFQNYLMLVLAAICIQIFTILDLVDGNIARAKGMQSKFGQWLDIFFDKLNDFLLITGLTLGAYLDIGREHVLILGMCLMGFVFFIQFVMVVNSTLLKTKKNFADQSNARGAFTGCSIKHIGRVALRHASLGHSAFLFLLSVFACLNKRYFGLWFLVVHACATLILITISTFYRLWQYEKIPIS